MALKGINRLFHTSITFSFVLFYFCLLIYLFFFFALIHFKTVFISPSQVSISGEWVPWSAKVPPMEVETHKVASPDIVVPTLDTVRHEELLYTWLADHKPMGT
jgi:hypothetical protein